MKRILLFGMLMFAGLTANAQLSNGTQAPDFTVTDVNGNTHTLSEYLDQGKNVILYISATWCGPCWNYHSSHTLADLHYAYGPGGTGDTVVLYVEGDAGTSISSIYGTNTATDHPNYPTQGNWAVGTPYPIIDSGAIGDMYAVNYFPTIYRICPAGTTTELDPENFTTMVNLINSGCGSMTQPQNHAVVKPQDVKMCETTGSFKTAIKNFGTNPITSATLVVKENGNVVATENFAGNVAMLNEAEVEFDAMEFNPASEYKVEVTNVNSVSPLTWWLAEASFDISTSNQISNNIVVNVYTDKYPAEMSWKIKDSNGITVYTGGPYQPGTQTSYGPDAQTVKTHNVTLPDGIDCYSVELLDSFGDGWTWGSTTHGLEIFTTEGPALWISGDIFQDSYEVKSAFSTTGTLGTVNFESQKFAVYPNPSNGIFTFSTPETVNISVSDITGKTVYTSGNIENGTSIDLSNLASGIYIAKVTGATTDRVEKLIIK
jgi:hypothetical protein